MIATSFTVSNISIISFFLLSLWMDFVFLVCSAEGLPEPFCRLAIAVILSLVKSLFPFRAHWAYFLDPSFFFLIPVEHFPQTVRTHYRGSYGKG